jgi:hypothetical protein
VFETWASALDSSDGDLIAYGPVEEISNNEILILGQRVEINDQKMISKIRVGDSIAVFGESSDAGIAASRILKSQVRFVDGSTPIYLAATTSGEQSSDGSFQVGSVSVIIGSAGANPKAFELGFREHVKISGIKIGDILVANDLVF